MDNGQRLAAAVVSLFIFGVITALFVDAYHGKEIKLSVRDKEEIALPWGGKLVYVNCIVGGSIDARFIPAIMKGLMEKMEQGPLTGQMGMFDW